MKTAMQEFLDELKSHGIEHSEGSVKELLEKEKQQIIDAFESGTAYAWTDIDPEYDANDYFSETFETNKETLK